LSVPVLSWLFVASGDLTTKISSKTHPHHHLRPTKGPQLFFQKAQSNL